MLIELQRKYCLRSPALGKRGTHNTQFQCPLTWLRDHHTKALILKIAICHQSTVITCLTMFEASQPNDGWFSSMSVSTKGTCCFLNKPATSAGFLGKEKNLLSHGSFQEGSKYKLTKGHTFILSVTTEQFLMKTAISESVL